MRVRLRWLSFYFMVPRSSILFHHYQLVPMVLYTSKSSDMTIGLSVESCQDL